MTQALPNVIFREADMLEAPSRGDITPSSLVVAIHGCNEVNQDSIEMVRSAYCGDFYFDFDFHLTLILIPRALTSRHQIHKYIKSHH